MNTTHLQQIEQMELLGLNKVEIVGKPDELKALHEAYKGKYVIMATGGYMADEDTSGVYTYATVIKCAGLMA